MRTDEYGETHPYVDENECIGCDLCHKVCPSITLPEFREPIKCYAFWRTDKKERRLSASGGIGAMIAESTIREGGVVFATIYDDNFIPHFSEITSINSIEKLKGSKYAQSTVGEETLKRIKELLISGTAITFIGTPCQVSGLIKFLGKDYSNLLTVDLLCHGVCPNTYFQQEIRLLKEENGIKEISDIRFRGNDKYNYWFTIWGKDGNGVSELKYKKKGLTQPYLAGFLLGVTLRENCFSCQYAKPQRVSDITIGDFLGIGKAKPFDYNASNISSITTNTPKGEVFYQRLTNMRESEMISVERDYSERLLYKSSLVVPAVKHPLRERFKDELVKVGFTQAIREVLGKECKKQSILQYLYYFKLIKKIPSFIKKKLRGA